MYWIPLESLGISLWLGFMMMKVISNSKTNTLLIIWKSVFKWSNHLWIRWEILLSVEFFYFSYITYTFSFIVICDSVYRSFNLYSSCCLSTGKLNFISKLLLLSSAKLNFCFVGYRRRYLLLCSRRRYASIPRAWVGWSKYHDSFSIFCLP